MDNGSYTENLFISGKTSKENAHFKKWWVQRRRHTVHIGTEGGAIKIQIFFSKLFLILVIVVLEINKLSDFSGILNFLCP